MGTAISDRIAIDWLLPEGSLCRQAFYWPSYEIVMDGFLRKWEPDRRHVKRPILDFIMTPFEKAWCKDGVSDANLAKALLRAKVADGSVRTSTYKRLREMTPSERRDFAHLLTLKKRPRLAETVLAAYD